MSVGSDSLGLACQHSVLIFDAQLNLLDVSDAYTGLPAEVVALGRCDAFYCITTADRVYQLNEADFTWQPTAQSPSQLPVQNTPAYIAEQILAQYRGSDLTWERVWLDIHAGRFLGAWGPWVMDFAALCFLLLAISGMYMWSQSAGKVTNKPRKKTKVL